MVVGLNINEELSDDDLSSLVKAPVRLVMADAVRSDLFFVLMADETIGVQIKDGLVDYESAVGSFKGCYGYLYITADGRLNSPATERGGK